MKEKVLASTIAKPDISTSTSATPAINPTTRNPTSSFPPRPSGKDISNSPTLKPNTGTPNWRNTNHKGIASTSIMNVIHQQENQDPRPNANTNPHTNTTNRIASPSPMDSIAIKTPQRGNVSSKHTSSAQTARTILSDLCYNDVHIVHVLYGAKGVGKTYCAYQCAQLPLAKKTFEGVIWIGLGYKRSLQFWDLVEVYQQIYAQLCPTGERNLDFDDILFVPSSSRTIKTEDEKLEERRAMVQARDHLAQKIASHGKNALIFLDGMYDSSDIRYFQFQTQNIKCRVLSTATDAPFDSIEHVKAWQINSMDAADSKKLFTRNLSTESLSHPVFASVLKDCHESCRGNPLSLMALCRLINDKVDSKHFGNLKKFVTKFDSAPTDPKMQVFIILETTFSHSSLGESFTKLAWRCFAAFCAVFTREGCLRPFIPRSPMRALFRAVIERVGKTSAEDSASTTETADKIVDFMVKVGVLTFIDGFDSHKSPRQFFQVSCDIYQEFGEQLSANKGTHKKLHELLINEYTSMFNGINASFGSNEIDFYMLKFLPDHSMQASELEDVALTLQDPRFIEERLKYMGLLNGCKKHIDDTEAMAELVRVANKKMASLILATSYQNCTRVLVKHLVTNNGESSRSEQDAAALNALWMLSFSLFKHFLVTDGCKILQKAMELDHQEKNKKILKLDGKLLIGSLSKTPSSNSNQCSRAVILIGSAMAQSSMKRRDAMHLLSIGLTRLEESLGAGTLEVARAHVYVGEIFYRDFQMYKHALQYFRDALPTFMKELGEESEELYDAIILIGKSCIHTGDLDTALDILRNIAPKLTGSIALDVNIKVGYIYIIKRNHDRAVAVLNKAKASTNDATIIDRIDQMIEKCVNQSGRYHI